MRLHYYSSVPNFGDDLNRWMWADLFGGALPANPQITLVGVGTIIGENIPSDRNIVILGSGVGYHRVPAPSIRASWRFLGVRGPLSASALGLSPAKIITDSALLLRALPCGRPLSDSHRNGGVVFMPHHQSDFTGTWEEICRRAGVRYLNPCGDSRATLETLRRAKLVLADAMHAAIVADALRVPWVPVATSLEISSFKWIDWTRSMNLEYRPVLIPPHSRSSQWREFVLRVLSLEKFNTPLDPETQLERWNAHQRKPSQPGEPLQAALRTRAAGKKVMRFIEKVDGFGALKRTDERLLDAAAKTLRQAACQPGLLSEDKVQLQKLDQLWCATRSISPRCFD